MLYCIKISETAVEADWLESDSLDAYGESQTFPLLQLWIIN